MSALKIPDQPFCIICTQDRGFIAKPATTERVIWGGDEPEPLCDACDRVVEASNATMEELLGARL